MLLILTNGGSISFSTSTTTVYHGVESMRKRAVISALKRLRGVSSCTSAAGPPTKYFRLQDHRQKMESFDLVLNVAHSRLGSHWDTARLLNCFFVPEQNVASGIGKPMRHFGGSGPHRCANVARV